MVSGGGRPEEGDRQGIANALDNIADQLSAASGAQTADSRRAGEQLGRAQELRDRLTQLERSVDELRRAGQEQAAAAQPPQQGGQAGQAGQGAAGAPGTAGQTPPAGRPGPERAEGGQSSSARSAGGSGQGGQAGGVNGNGSGRLEQLQRDVNDQMREAARLAQSLGRERPGLQGPNSDDGWWRSLSAPGTEAFKQDFSRWETLKQHLLVALEDVETQLSGELRERANKQRLNAGGHDAVSDPYRALVEKYYRSLAAPRK